MTYEEVLLGDKWIGMMLPVHTRLNANRLKGIVLKYVFTKTTI
jgi:hypothetical protein